MILLSHKIVKNQIKLNMGNRTSSQTNQTAFSHSPLQINLCEVDFPTNSPELVTPTNKTNCQNINKNINTDHHNVDIHLVTELMPESIHVSSRPSRNCKIQAKQDIRKLYDVRPKVV
jgi:hypothetical protein